MKHIGSNLCKIIKKKEMEKVNKYYVEMYYNM